MALPGRSFELRKVLAGLVLVALVLGSLLVSWLDEGGASSPPGAGEVEAITVAAASDVRPAFEELGRTLAAATGVDVRFSFGSSGQLREQVLNGAPFDVFASADAADVDQVIAAGRGVASSRADYAEGRLALWARPGTPVPADLEALVGASDQRIAIANPDHAPYGRAAEQALEAAGVLPAGRDRLVYGESVADALRIARSGNAEVAVVALSLAIASGDPHQPLPDDLHAPLRQALVVTATGARAGAAQAFADHVVGPAGRDVLARYGFAPPRPAATG